jgi:hypothetical protein
VPIVSGNGGSQPVNTPGGVYDSGSTVICPTGVRTPLEWGYGSGAQLLDLSVPTQPAVITAGLYAVTAEFQRSGGTTLATDAVTIELDIDTGGSFGYVFKSMSLLAVDGASNQDTLTLSWYAPAGAVIQATVEHNIGSDRILTLIAAVQNLS